MRTKRSIYQDKNSLPEVEASVCMEPPDRFEGGKHESYGRSLQDPVLATLVDAVANQQYLKLASWRCYSDIGLAAKTRGGYTTNGDY